MLEFLIKNYRIILLILLVLISIIAIHPNIQREGALVVASGVEGINPGDIIIEINGIKIKNSFDFEKVKEKNFSYYRILVKKEIFPYIYITKEIFSRELKVSVIDVPIFRIKLGIDLAGGSRIILKPEENATDAQIEAAKEIIEKRLDFYGLKGADVRLISGFKEKYILIEMPGNPEEILEIIEKQGKLEAKIGNKTVFTGNDIIEVCTYTSHYCVSEIVERENYWEGVFGLIISKEAAKRFANLTKDLEEICDYECYLNETLDIYLDEELITKLRISADLKGKEVQNPAITIKGPTKDYVKREMRKLQTILMTGKLPIKLEVSRIEKISPLYGKRAFSNILLVWIASIAGVSLFIFLRYRNPKIAFLMFLIILIETFSTLGVASLIGWTLDISSFAGIIAAVGTNLDDQIIVTEEVLFGRKEEKVERSIKKAFFIVIATFAVAFVSMVPLLFAGAGILKGFAITNIIGIVIGVLITRPAYADLLKKVLK